MKTTRPFVPYDDRFILVPIMAAKDAGLIDPKASPGRGMGGGGGLTTKPDIDTIVRGFNDVADQLKRYVEYEEGAGSARNPGRGISRDDFPGSGSDTPATTAPVTSSTDLARLSFDDGLQEAIRILKDGKSTKEQHLAAYYYQLGALTGRGLAIQIDPVEVLAAPEKVTRSCDSRGACKELGEKLDKLFERMSRGGGRGFFKELGDWGDKVRDCIND
jgi:hypothetical protein